MATCPVKKKFKLSEEEYEKIPRDAEWKDEQKDKDGILHYRLPLKTNKGLLLQEPITLDNNKEGSDDEDENETNEFDDDNMESDEYEHHSGIVSDDESINDEQQEHQETQPALSMAQLLVQRENQLKKKKEIIANVSSCIMEDPQTNVIQTYVIVIFKNRTKMTVILKLF
jgi:hypothetical protein